MALPIWIIFMKKVWNDKSLGIRMDDKFIKPSDWNGGCGDLPNSKNGYGDIQGLQTLDELKNSEENQEKLPKTEINKPEHQNINDNLNQSNDIDFNQ